MSAIGTKRTFCVAAVTYLTSGRDLLREGSSRGTRGAPVVLAAPDFGKTGEPGSGTPEERIEIARRSRDYTVSAGQRIHDLSAAKAREWPRTYGRPTIR